MKYFVLFLIVLPALAQTPPPDELLQPGSRVVQLMESTAVAFPGMAGASETLRRSAESILTAIKKTPQDPAARYRFLKQVEAYVALLDAQPRPADLPAEAEKQYSELRGDIPRLERQLEALLETANANARANLADPANLKKYAEADSKLLPPGKAPRVVFVGDSATEPWRLNEYFPGRDYINRGIAGQNTLGIVGRFYQDVTALHPRVVVIQAGSEDVREGTIPAEIENNLATIADLAKAHGIKPLIASLVGTQAAAINQWLQDYCRREGLIYVNYFAAIADSAGNLRPDLTDDGQSPNARGYRVMSPIALEAIERALAVSEPTPSADSPRRRFRLLNK